MKNAELKRLLNKAITREESYIAFCKNTDQRDNPQIIQGRLKAEGRLDALEAVLAAVAKNESFDLKVLAGE